MENVDKVIDQALTILRKKPVDGYEVYLEESSHFEVESKNAKVDTLEASRSWGLALRVLKSERIGFSYTTSPILSPTELEEKVQDAIASAEVTSPDPCFDFAPVLGDLPQNLPIFDGSLERVTEGEKIGKAKLLEEVTRSVDPDRVKKVRKASYQEEISHITLINSNGLYFSYDTTLTSINVMAVAERSGESEVGWDFDSSHFFSDLDVRRVGEAAGRKALERLGGRRISSGTFPVILDRYVASEFLSLLAHSFSAEQVLKGKSPLMGKRGERFFSPLLSILDDGLFPKGVSTLPIDGEGMPSQRTPLVVEGEVSGYLYDRFWANRENLLSKEARTESTGNSRRLGIKFPPGLGTSNFFITPGKATFQSLLKEVQKGLVVEEVMGVHTVDPISGDFSLGCSGQWVEGGEKVHPVKGIAIAGNLFQLFKRVKGIGEDLRFFGKIGSPSLLIESLEISGN